MMKTFDKIKRTISAILSISVVCAAVPVSMTAYAAPDENGTEISIAEEGSNVEAVDGTTGAPLGGFGAGAVKFNAINGSFAATILPPTDWQDYKVAGKSRFQFYSKVGDKIENMDTMTARVEDGRYDDDAIWPLHNVDFGETNGIQINMEAFSPLDNENYDNMVKPYAFYEMTLTNTNDASADAAVALLWDISTGGKTKKGDKSTLEYVDGKGFKSDMWAVYAEAERAQITAGSDDGFNTSGVCNNTPSADQTRTAVKVQLAANETKTIKFVLAWYNDEDPENAYYFNLDSNAGEVAQDGLDNFNRLKANAEGLVSRMRGSNVPAWYVNQCLNSLANISNNTMYKKDGRVAFSEGQWTCFGTMDQMWHARQIMGNLIPDLVWKELEYWARTQRDDGQIHHDFNYMTDTSIKSRLVDWDDHENLDYRDTLDENGNIKLNDGTGKWVDLNCGFIISIYETYQQTADDEKLEYFWPYIKKAGQRILDQVELFGDPDYPYTFKTSSNSYDAGGDPNPFNTSISAVAYKVMTILCDKMGESELKETYQEAYDKVVASYEAKYIDNGFPTGRVSESFFAGQWLALHLKLGEIWSQEDTDKVVAALDDYYHPYYKHLGFPEGTYTEWAPYMLIHYGGLLLNTQRQNQYEALQKDDYERQFENRNLVFNHALNILPAVTVANYAATNISSKQQYISIPTVWRNYYDVIGFRRDAATKELWLEPLLLPEMNHVMTNAAYISPEGCGTISCTESTTEGSEVYQNKNITFKPEKAVEVGNLYLKDNFGEDESITVTIDGEEYPFTRQGTGYAKELVVEYNGTVTPEGINIVTTGAPGEEPPALPEKPDDLELPDPVAKKSAYSRIEGEKPDETGHAEEETDGDISYLTNIDDQEYAQYKSLGFEEGAGAIELTLRSTKQSMIELRLDSNNGELIQELAIPNTNGEWQTVKYDLEKVIDGTHGIAFNFRCVVPGDTDLLDLDSFTFEFKYRLPSDKWTATGSKNSNDAYKAFDGDGTSRWNTGYQEGVEWFLLDLGEVRSFNRILLDNSNNKDDYPRRYEVLVSEDGVNFETVALGKGQQTATTITFERAAGRYIKIAQLEEAAKYWSLCELKIFNDAENYPSGIQDIPPLGPDDTINEYTYTGTSTSYAKETKYFDIKKYDNGKRGAGINSNDKEFKFGANVSVAVKKEFARGTGSDIISSTYTGRYINYIGQKGDTDVKPAITDITLQPGEYKLYYIGGNANRDVKVNFVNDEGNTVSTSVLNTYQFTDNTNKLYMYEWTVTLSEAYTGDINFSIENEYLPDLYSVKLVPTRIDVPDPTPAPDTTYTTYTFENVKADKIKLNCGETTGNGFVKINGGEPKFVSLVNGEGTLTLAEETTISSVAVAAVEGNYPAVDLIKSGRIGYDDLTISAKRKLPAVTCQAGNGHNTAVTFTSSENDTEIMSNYGVWFDGDLDAKDLGNWNRFYWNKYKESASSDHRQHGDESYFDCKLIITASLKEAQTVTDVKLFTEQSSANEPTEVTVKAGDAYKTAAKEVDKFTVKGEADKSANIYTANVNSNTDTVVLDVTGNKNQSIQINELAIYSDHVVASAKPDNGNDDDNKYPYEIKSISLKTEDGASLENAPSDKAFLVDVELDKAKAREDQDYLFIAVYDTAGALLSLDYVRAKFAENYTYSFGFHVPKQDKEIGEIKVFVWNDFSSMESLCESKVLR